MSIYLLLDCGQFFAFFDAASAKQQTHAVAAAFECLRLANLFGMPSEATIQALLMIELAIANDTNPGMAWSLIGALLFA